MCFSATSFFTRQAASTALAVNSEDNKNGEKKLLGGRVTINLRIIPPLIALIACIAAVVYCVIMNHVYLTFLFGAGAAGSVYALYLAHQYKLLKTFGENNESFQQKLKTMENQLKDSERINSELKESSEKIQAALNSANETAKLLDGSVKTLNLENDRLKTSISTLEQTSKELETEKDRYKKQHDLYIEQLKSITNTFGEINKEALTQQTNLKFDVTTLSQAVSKFEENQSAFDSNFAQTSDLMQNLKNEMKELLIKQAQFVHAITNQKEYATFAESVTKLAEQAATYKNQAQLSQTQLEERQKQLDEMKKMLADLKREIEEQKKLKESILQSSTQLSSDVSKMTRENAKLTNNVCAITLVTNDLIYAKSRQSTKPYSSVPTNVGRPKKKPDDDL